MCVVIGIGPGNGASFARRFAREGYRVALLSRGRELSDRLAAELEGARAYTCDASDPASIEEAFGAIEAELGAPSVVVYNAGSGVWGTFDEITLAGFEMAWRVNALGLLAVARRVAPAMRAAGGGSIIVVGATASRRGVPRTAASRRPRRRSAAWPSPSPAPCGPPASTSRSSSWTASSTCRPPGPG